MPGDAYLRRTYDISAAEWEAIWEHQGRRCPICGNPGTVRMAVDHDHAKAAPYVRGIICAFRCNLRLIGGGMDRPDLHDAAAAYLRNPPARAVIGDRAVPSKPKKRRAS